MTKPALEPRYEPEIPSGAIEGIDDKKLAISIPKGAVLSLVPSSMSNEQIMSVRAPTPPAFTKKMEGRGGKQLTYVPVAIYIRKLNFTYGYGNWSFEIVKSQVIEDQALVEGRITTRNAKDSSIVSQFGGHPIARELLAFEKRNESISPWEWKKLMGKEKDGWTKKYGAYIDVGDSFKAAASDCFKKCASMLGFFSDIYSPEEFQNLQKEKEPEDPSKEVEGFKKIIEKSSVKEMKLLVTKIKGSKKYTEAQREELIAVIDARMKILPDGEPTV